MIKYLLKKYWIHLVFILLINIPIIIFATVRTNYALILKGGTDIFNSVVEIETNYKEEGSFSTIYVVSSEKTTLFQNMISDLVPTVEKYKMSSYTSHLSAEESYKADKIYNNTSIDKSIILAYLEAQKDNSSINIDYVFYSYKVVGYGPKSQFRIDDDVIGINDIDNSNQDELINALRSPKINDKVKVIRDNKEMELILKEGDSYTLTDNYKIEYNTLFPKLTIKPTNVGGPSGGLLQTLSIYNQLIEEDLTHGFKIAGTGTIDIDGKVGAIGGILEKVPTAYDNHVDIFLCVSANYDDALKAYNSLPSRNKMKLIKIDTFYDALEYLKEGYLNDFKL